MNDNPYKVLMILTVICVLAVVAVPADDTALAPSRQSPERDLPGWRTNTARRLIGLNELESGGPGKDGIPAINNPRFVSPRKAQRWLKPKEPVVSVVLKGQAKAYPLQILIWHEIVNDKIANTAVMVTFCPLCYSAIVFDRTVKGKEYTFGVSGMLRHSNLVLYDRQTESLWQQLTGRAIVGDMVGSALKSLPAQIISFEQFRSAYKDGLVLSRKTGVRRNYGRNPYVGYDDISGRPFMYRGKSDERLKPMEKVVAVSINNVTKAYPYEVTQKKRAINDRVGEMPIVVFHGAGAVSALDRPEITRSREVGSTGVFDRKVEGQLLSFRYEDGKFHDEETGTVWDITGAATEGPLKGQRLSPVAHGDYFAFAWLVFKPETKIYRGAE
ncbi:MAG: DUF3179 domain-containing protein [Planctomycetota bacterium]|jgi:hypothetical protein